MEEVLVRTNRKIHLHSLYQTTAPTFKLHSFPPLYLQANRDYEVAMVNLETYYSFANIRKGNNSFKWSVDEGMTWTLLHIPTGCYELKAINAEITCIRGNSDITILPNVNTLKCILTVVAVLMEKNSPFKNDYCNYIFRRDI